MTPIRRFTHLPILALLLALTFLSLAVTPTLADGGSPRRPRIRRSVPRTRLVAPRARNHRRNDLATSPARRPATSHLRQSLRRFGSVEHPGKPEMRCPGCPGDERTSIPHRSGHSATPNIDRPGPPHPPRIDDGRWPRPDWPPVTITFPPPRDDPHRRPSPLLKLKPRPGRK